MSGWLLILSLLVLGGVLSTLGDRLGSRVGKARLSLFNMRPRRTAVVITVLTGEHRDHDGSASWTHVEQAQTSFSDSTAKAIAEGG